MKMNKYLSELIKLIEENPELPIVPMVDGEIVADDSYGYWMGSWGHSQVSEYCIFNDRWYDDRDSFKEDYYGYYDDELCERFKYDPRISEWSVKKGQHTLAQLEINKHREKCLDEHLNKIANEYFTKAIIVYIGLPE